MKKTLLLMFMLLIGSSVLKAQLKDNTLAPDFNLTDINGKSHHLYDYLNKGKTVVVDFSAVWCDPCWSLHASGALETIWSKYGPNGSIDTNMIVLFIEGDGNSTLNMLKGIGGSSATQGNWLAGTSYPTILTDQGLLSTNLRIDYNVTVFPSLYVICPDRIIRSIDTRDDVVSTAYAMSKQCPKLTTNINDAKIIEVESPTNGVTYCSNNISPKVLIQNYGTAPLKSLILTATNNTTGAVYSTMNWTGNLPKYGAQTITMPEIQGLSDGTITFKLATSRPNGVQDENTANDNTNITSNINTSYSLFSIEINTDDRPYELSLNMTTGTATTKKYIIDEYSISKPGLYTYNLCLDPKQNYTFNFKDAGRDGGSSINIKKDGIGIYNNVAWATSAATFTYDGTDKIAPVPDITYLPTIQGQCNVTITDIPTATDNKKGQIIGTTKDQLTYSSQGSYVITWSYDDGDGNIATQTQTVIVKDNIAPVPEVLNLPIITGPIGTSLIAPVAYDNCAKLITGTTKSPTTYYSAGTYIIAWIYDDGNGNISTQNQTLIITSVTAPVPTLINLPTIMGKCSATVSARPTATDMTGKTVTATTTDQLTYTNQGVYTITWKYDDGNGNISTQAQLVVIKDDEAPIADVANLPVINGSIGTKLIAPTATDNCSNKINGTTNSPLTFNSAGIYIVTWTYNDGNGNSTIQNQIVSITNTTAPVPTVLNLPTITGNCSAMATTTPTAIDMSGKTITATTTDQLGYTSQGTYTITWKYDDGNGNISTQAQLVIVKDDDAPIADVANLPVINGKIGTTVIAPTATDICAGKITGTSATSLTYNTAGTYIIIWTYNDGNGNTASQIQTVIISSATAPVPTTANLPIITGECGAMTSTTPTATDITGKTITASTDDQLTYSTQGSYIITWKYDDGNGNIFNQAQMIVIKDNTAPSLSLPANVTKTISAEKSFTATGTELDPTASSDECGIATLLNDYNNKNTLAGATFDKGTHTITWTATDVNGNKTDKSMTVTVSVSGNVGIDNSSETLRPTVYPNPVTNGIVNIVIPESQTTMVTITDVIGKTIVSKLMTEGINTVDLSGNEAGVYFVKIFSNVDGKMKVEKLIVR